MAQGQLPRRPPEELDGVCQPHWPGQWCWQRRHAMPAFFLSLHLSLSLPVINHQSHQLRGLGSSELLQQADKQIFHQESFLPTAKTSYNESLKET